MEQDLGNGRTPLLVASRASAIWPPTIQLLLDRGANITARDHREETCLHLAFEGSPGRRSKNPFHGNLQASLILLVEAGADIHAVDKHDRSVSRNAIHDRHWNIWEAVLRDCGKDISRFRFEMREKGYALPGDPDYEKCECVRVSDSDYSDADTSESDDDDRYSEEADPQHDIHQPGDRDETENFQDGFESDSDYSLGGAELSFGAV